MRERKTRMNWLEGNEGKEGDGGLVVGKLWEEKKGMWKCGGGGLQVGFGESCVGEEGCGGMGTCNARTGGLGDWEGCEGSAGVVVARLG